MDNTVNADPFIGPVDIFGHRTKAGRLAMAKKMKNPQIRRAGRRVLDRKP